MASSVAIAIGIGVALAGAGVEATSRIGTKVLAELTEVNASAGRDLIVQADSSARITKARAVGVAVSTSLAALSIAASNVVNDIVNDVRAWIASASTGTGTNKTVTAGRDVSVRARMTEASIANVGVTTASISVGFVGASGGGLGITNTIDNTVQAYVGGADTNAATTTASLGVTAGRAVLVEASEVATASADAAAVTVSISLGLALGVAIVKNKIASDVAAWVLGATILSVDTTITASSNASVPLSRAVGVSASLVAANGNSSVVELSPLVTAWVQRAVLASTGTVTVAATGTNTGRSEAHGGTLGALAVGAMEARLTLGRGTGVDEVTAGILTGTQVLAGTLAVSATSIDDIRSAATAAGAAAIDASGAAAYVTTDQATLVTIAGNTTITVGALDVRSDHSQAVDGSADAYSFALASGSGAGVGNTVNTKANVDIGATAITGVVITIAAQNTLRKRYYADNGQDNLVSGSVNLAGLGVLASVTSIGTSANPFQAVVTISTGASLIANGSNRSPGILRVEALTDISAIDSVNATGVSLAGTVTVAVSQIIAYTKAAVVITGATLQNTAGDLFITTRAESAVRPSANVLTVSGITSATSGTAKGATTSDQTITLTDATIKGGNVKIYAGRSASTGSPNLQDVNANVEMFAASTFANLALPVVLADLTERNTITLAGSTAIKSLGDVDLLAVRGLGSERTKTSGMTLSLSLIPYGFDAPDGATDTSTNTVTIGGSASIEAGLNSTTVVLIRPIAQLPSGRALNDAVTLADKAALRALGIAIPDDVPYSYKPLNLGTIKFAIGVGDIIKDGSTYYQYIAQDVPPGGIDLETAVFTDTSTWRVLGATAFAATSTRPYGPAVSGIGDDYYDSDVTTGLKLALAGKFFVLAPDSLDAPTLTYQNVGTLLLEQRQQIVDWITSHANNIDAVARYQLQLDSLDQTLADLGISQTTIQVATGNNVLAPNGTVYRFIGGSGDLIVLREEDFTDTARWSAQASGATETPNLVKGTAISRDLDTIFLDLPSIYAAPGSIFIQADESAGLRNAIAGQVGTVLNARAGGNVTIKNESAFGMKVDDVIISDNKRITVVDGALTVLEPGNVYLNAAVIAPRTPPTGTPQISITQNYSGDPSRRSPTAPATR